MIPSKINAKITTNLQITKKTQHFNDYSPFFCGLLTQIANFYAIFSCKQLDSYLAHTTYLLIKTKQLFTSHKTRLQREFDELAPKEQTPNRTIDIHPNYTNKSID